MKKLITKIVLFAFILSLPVISIYAEATNNEGNKVMPAPLLMMDSFFAHHVLVAEKSTHLLHLFKNVDGKPELVHSYQIVTGKKAGDKETEGDFRTPEGIYNFVDFLTNKQLVAQSGPQGAIYGAGAFVTDYPNVIDRNMKKTGSGIWLHSTNDETRIDKGLDSRGCVVTANNELIDVSKYLELNKTPIVIVQDLLYLNEKTYNTQKDELKKLTDGWLEAWRKKDIEAYASYYHPTEFSDAKGKFFAYKNYKKAVFSNPGQPKIELDHISILKSKSYAVITFTQSYQSNTVNDTGRKLLYLKQDDNYNWKIVSEVFTKNGLENMGKVAFEPSLRFFKEGEAVKNDKGNN
ncbi:MAG: L,D-transpeptidase family protein [Bacteriovorax sp.]|nr:L,D-transpeptidase family protein [Bacteriovorax sp.]